MAFHEVQFPPNISYGSSGGPERKTEVAVLGSGDEERNAVWADSRRSFNAASGIKTLDDVHTIIAFFEARNARLYGFRWKDWADYKSCTPKALPQPTDHNIGTGNGSTATFQLVKKYSSGGTTWTRTIKKPVAGTVRVAVAGTEKTLGTHFNVDTTTGIVTFTGGNIPTSGQAVTAGFEFDVPVRFDTDKLSINLSAFEAGEIQDIPITEVKR